MSDTLTYWTQEQALSIVRVLGKSVDAMEAIGAFTDDSPCRSGDELERAAHEAMTLIALDPDADANTAVFQPKIIVLSIGESIEGGIRNYLLSCITRTEEVFENSRRVNDGEPLDQDVIIARLDEAKEYLDNAMLLAKATDRDNQTNGLVKSV